MYIRGLHSGEGHCYLQYSQQYSASFKITNWIYHLFTSIFCSHTMSTNGSPPNPFNMAPSGGLFGSQQCPDTNVGAANNNAGNTPSKDSQFGQQSNNFIHHQGVVTRLHSFHRQTLPSSTTLPHSTWQQAHTKALLQPRNIRVIDHLGNNTTSPKEVMVDLKWFPLSNSHGRGHHHQAHLECLQQHLETFQWFGRHHLPRLYTDSIPVHLGHTPIPSQRNDFSHLRNCASQMLQGLQICPCCQRFLMTKSLLILRVMIGRACAGPKAMPKSAWSKRNSPRRNLPKGWASPTLVHSTSGWKYAWLGFTRRNIGPLSWNSTIWNSGEMDLCTGKQPLQIFWKLSRSGCLWNILIMQNGLGDRGLRWFWRNVAVRLGMGGRREGKATSNQRRIRESTCAHKGEVTFHSWKYNCHGCDSSSARWQQWPDIQRSTSSFIYTCEALGGADWFSRRKLFPDWTTLSDCNIQMQLETGIIGRRVYGIMCTRANDEWPFI